MNFRIEHKKILKGISLFSNICQSKSTKPILQDIMLIAKSGKLEITGTDLEVAVRYIIDDIEINEEGTIVIPAIKLLNMVREISNEEIFISTDQKICFIKSSDAEFSLICDDPEEFPIIPTYDFSDAVKIDVSNFEKYALKTLFATAKDMGCYSYNGILIEIYDKGIKLVATDGRRLSVAGDVARNNTNLLSNSVVPVKGISQILKCIDDDLNEIYLVQYKNQFIIKMKNIEISTRILEGEFPKYRDVIPEKNDIEVFVNREKLISALRKASITAGNEVRSVKFTFQTNTLKLYSQQEGIGETNTKTEINYSGNKFNITFNPDFLLDYLRVSISNEIRLNFKDENSSCIIYDENNDNTFYIVMPITAR